MPEQDLISSLRTLNESELFYRSYREAARQEDTLRAFMEGLSREMVERMELLIPQWPETLLQEYLENHFFSQSSPLGIQVFKHNCYTPPVPHSHDFFEMFNVMEGHCRHRVSGVDSELHTGDFCLIRPRVVHALDVSDESIVLDILIRRSTFRSNFFSILHDNNLFSRFFMSAMFDARGLDYLIFHTMGDSDLRDEMLELMRECQEEGRYYTILVNAILTRLFVLLLRRYADSCEQPQITDKNSETILEITGYIQSHASQVTLEEVADHFHYTPEHVSRQIHQMTGHTFIQLLTRLRLENAAQLLQNTSLSTADIAEAIGYQSSEHFARVFKKSRGMTPSEYRKRNRQPL